MRAFLLNVFKLGLNSDYMFSACFARLLTTLSGIRLQFLISTQFEENDCLKWGHSLQKDIETFTGRDMVEPILSRLIDDPSFAIGDLRHNSISSTIISFTACVEFYLRDIIELVLRRNSGLRKKALSSFQISALKLEEYSNIDEIKIQLFKSISSENSKGSLFTNKFQKASTFLSLTSSPSDKEFLKALDSIWTLRNKIAHVNHNGIKKYTIYTGTEKLQIDRNASREEYQKFVFEVTELISLSCNYLLRWEKALLEKWKQDTFPMI